MFGGANRDGGGARFWFNIPIGGDPLRPAPGHGSAARSDFEA